MPWDGMSYGGSPPARKQKHPPKPPRNPFKAAKKQRARIHDNGIAPCICCKK